MATDRSPSRGVRAGLLALALATQHFAGQAQVQGRVQWRDDVLVLDRLQARNDRYEVLARLRLQGGQRQGDLYAKWRALSLGVEMQGTQRTFHPVRARAWYDSRPNYLK